MTTVDDTLVDARLLTESGDWDAAIRLLTATNRATRTDEVERALADIRHRSWVELTQASPGPQAEPSVPGPAIGDSGLPEASLEGLTANDVRAAMLEHGTLVVPGAIDAETIDQLKQKIDMALEVADEPDDIEDRGNSLYWPIKLNRVALDTLAAEPEPLRRRFIHEAGGVLLADSPRTMFDIVELYESLGLYEIISEFLGDRPVMSANKCTLRRVEPDKIGGWHQDGAFLGDHIRAINIWLTLTPCGTEAPGLDIVAERVDHLVETGTHGSFFDWAAGDELIEAQFGSKIVRPQLEAGDIVIFDEMNMHRSAFAPGMTKQRHAIEFWCFAASTVPPGHIPLVW